MGIGTALAQPGSLPCAQAVMVGFQREPEIGLRPKQGRRFTSLDFAPLLVVQFRALERPKPILDPRNLPQRAIQVVSLQQQVLLGLCAQVTVTVIDRNNRIEETPLRLASDHKISVPRRNVVTIVAGQLRSGGVPLVIRAVKRVAEIALDAVVTLQVYHDVSDNRLDLVRRSTLHG